MKKMNFSEFANLLYGVIGGGQKTSAFARSLFETIVDEEKIDEANLESKSASSYASYFNGSVGITNLALGLNVYLDEENFVNFLDKYPDSTRSSLSEIFTEYTDENLNSFNISEFLAHLFKKIIIDAASTKVTRSSAKKKTSAENHSDTILIDEDMCQQNGSDVDHLEPATLSQPHADVTSISPKNRMLYVSYLQKASEYMTPTKTLLYTNPRPFYDFYITNNLNTSGKKTHLEDISAWALSLAAHRIIIAGTGGSGKSMMMKHLFFTAAEDFISEKEYARVPVLFPLRDYSSSDKPLLDYAYDRICSFFDVDHEHFIWMCKSGKILFLFDGLDEISKDLISSFESEIDLLAKKYSGCKIVLSSRPTSSFISLSGFQVFMIEPFSKKQALELISKLEYDDVIKEKFSHELDKNLYTSHREFAGNPLLLTMMLMTYSTIGEIPEKAHVFYKRVYDTMAREHDATKGSYKRPFSTRLTPDVFADFLAEFCARTYMAEVFEFDKDTFTEYMRAVVKSQKRKHPVEAAAADFLKDLTDHLCIMYREGDRYYFIHRSFQEYFTARFFRYQPENTFSTTAKLLEKRLPLSGSDLTLPMLYDMIPTRMDKLVFIPMLRKILEECKSASGYDTFLKIKYPVIYAETGTCIKTLLTRNESNSPLYRFYLQCHNGRKPPIMENVILPDSAREFIAAEYAYVHQYYLSSEDDYHIYQDETELKNVNAIDTDYVERFGEPEIVGTQYEIVVEQMNEYPGLYVDLIAMLRSPDCPLRKEYDLICDIVQSYDATKSEFENSGDLFDRIYE